MTFDVETCQYGTIGNACRAKTQQVVRITARSGTTDICVCAIHAALITRRAGEYAKVIEP